MEQKGWINGIKVIYKDVKYAYTIVRKAGLKKVKIIGRFI